MKKIRWGIVGPGKIAHRFAEAIRKVEEAELVAVASRDQGRAEAFAEEYAIPYAFWGYEKMAEAREVDAVYIATPHSHHAAVAELFMNRGKHVLCEKPLCVNAVQGQQLQDCAKKNGVFLMEALWTNFLPATKALQALISREEIGKILGVEADFCIAAERGPNRLYRKDLAGGALLDTGVYGLNFAAMILGNNPKRTVALSHTDGEVDLHTNILLQYESGALANITCAIDLKKPSSAYVYGTKGYIYVPHFLGASDLYIRKAGCEEEHIAMPYRGNGFEEEIIEACACIRAGKTQSEQMPLSRTLSVLKLMDEVREQIGVSYPLEGERK